MPSTRARCSRRSRKRSSRPKREAPGAGAVISLAAFFAPDDIPEELFAQPPECYPPALAELLTVPGGMDDAIGALAHLSLVDFHPEKRTFSVHRLVQAAARDALGEEAPAWSRQRAADRTLGISGARVQDVAAVRAPGGPRARRGGARDRGQQGAGLAARTTGDYLRGARGARRGPAASTSGPGTSSALPQTDPGNADWQRDLSVSFNKIGDVQSARGNLDAALRAYQDSLAIPEKLAAQDPGNTEWQRDLSVSFERIGDVQRARGNLDAALKAYQDSLAIREKLAAQDPSNTEWQRDLIVSNVKLAEVAEKASRAPRRGGTTKLRSTSRWRCAMPVAWRRSSLDRSRIWRRSARAARPRSSWERTPASLRRSSSWVRAKRNPTIGQLERCSVWVPARCSQRARCDAGSGCAWSAPAVRSDQPRSRKRRKAASVFGLT